MGCPPPEQGRLNAADFSADFLHIVLDSGIPIFNRQNVEEKSAHQKSAQESAHAKNRFAHCKEPFRIFRFSGRWKPEEKAQKRSAPHMHKTPAPRGLGKGAGEKGPLVFLKPSKISLHSIPPHWGPLGPRPFLSARGRRRVGE